jgi:hypothetical protein
MSFKINNTKLLLFRIDVSRRTFRPSVETHVTAPSRHVNAPSLPSNFHIPVRDQSQDEHGRR